MPSYQVEILPAKKHYICSSKQTLLHAGIESGLNLKFGCDGGSCGECQVQLLSGDLRKIKNSDFPLTEKQKNDQIYLSCCYAPASDIQIRANEIGGVDEIPQQTIQTRVYKLEALSDTVMRLMLKTPRSQPLTFLAGQYVTLTLTEELSRNKSLASCPCDGLRPEFHIKQKPGDPYSAYVFGQLKKNQNVTVNGPQGHFVLDDASNRPLILMAFDTGFASIKSLLEHAIALEKEQSIQFYWLLTPDNQPYMENYCLSIQHALDNFNYVPVFLEECSKPSIDNALRKLIQQEKNISQSDVYVTLPQQCRNAAREMFFKAGLDERHWHIDLIQKI